MSQAFFESVRNVTRSKNAEAVLGAIHKAQHASLHPGTDRSDDEHLHWYAEYMVDQIRSCSVVAGVSTGVAAGVVATYSLAQMHYIYIAIELLWEWRIRRHFESKGESHTLCLSSIEVIDPSVMGCCNNLALPTVDLVWETIVCISDAIHCPAFQRVAMPRNMGRVLVTLILLASPGEGDLSAGNDAGTAAPADDVAAAATVQSAAKFTATDAEARIKVILRGAYKNLVVTGLQSTARCSQLVKARTSQLLQELLLLPGGLEAVMRGYAHESMQIGMIVRVLTSTPKGATRESYLRALSPQLVQLVRDAAAVSDAAVLSTCAGMLLRMVVMCPAVVQEGVLAVLGRPLLLLLQGKAPGSISLPGSRSHSILASHEAVQQSTLSLAALVRASPSSGPLIAALDAAGLAQPLIMLALHCLACVARLTTTTTQTQPSAATAAASSSSPNIQRGNCVLLDAAADLCAAYFKACPERAAALLELCIVIPPPNSFHAGAAIISSSSSTRCHAEICVGQGQRESPGGGETDAVQEACAAVLQAGELAAELCLLLVRWFDPAGLHDGGYTGGADSPILVMVSALCAHSLASFLQVSRPRGKAAEDEEGGAGEAEAGVKMEAGEGEVEMSSSGASMVFLIMQQHLPVELLLRDRAAVAPILAAFLGQFAAQVELMGGDWGRSARDRDGSVRVRVSARGSMKSPHAMHKHSEREEEEEEEEEESDDDDSVNAMALTALNLVHQCTLLEIAKSSRAASTDTSSATGQPSPLACLLGPLQRVAALRYRGDISQFAAEAGLSVLACTLDAPMPGMLLAAGSSTTGCTPCAAAPLSSALVSPEIAELLQSGHPAMQALGCKALVQAYTERARRWQRMTVTSGAQREGGWVVDAAQLGQGQGGSSDSSPSEEDLRHVMGLLLALLKEPESFVYLCALHGFVALAGVGGLWDGAPMGEGREGQEGEMGGGARGTRQLRGDRTAVVVFLLEAFAAQGQGSTVGIGAAGAALGIRERTLAGEGLFMVVRKYGNVFGSDVLARVAAGCMSMCRVRVAKCDGALDEGAAATAAAREAGDDPIFLSVSAVSVLAELVAAAGAGVGYLPLHEVLDGVLYLLAWQLPVGGQASEAEVGPGGARGTGSLPAAAFGEMRRACSFLLHRIVAGLGAKVFYLDQGAVIKAVYQVLKRCIRDADKVVVHHSENCLAAIDTLVTQQFSGDGTITSL